MRGSLRPVLPVKVHEFVRPSGLAHFLARQKLSHDRFEIEHGRAIDCIQFGDEQSRAFHPADAADGTADSVGPVLASLREDAYQGPLAIVSRVPRAANDFRRVHPMKYEQYLDMREIHQALQGICGKRRSQGNAGFFSAPIIVFGVMPLRFHKTDGLQFDVQDRLPVTGHPLQCYAMSLALDHAFIMCSIGAPEGEALVERGFVEGSRNVHPGQGTANRRFFFENFMLELVWVDKPEEAQNAQTRRTRLWERWVGREDRTTASSVHK
jgi:hypothetical protein